jgi:hypothetical protein
MLARLLTLTAVCAGALAFGPAWALADLPTHGYGASAHARAALAARDCGNGVRTLRGGVRCSTARSVARGVRRGEGRSLAGPCCAKLVRGWTCVLPRMGQPTFCTRGRSRISIR